MKRFLICLVLFTVGLISCTNAAIDAWVRVVNRGNCTITIRNDAIYSGGVQPNFWGSAVLAENEAWVRHIYNTADSFYGYQLRQSSPTAAILTPTHVGGTTGGVFYVTIGSPGECIAVCDETGINDANDAGQTDCKRAVGLPVWGVSEPYLSVWLHDQPLGYQPAVGPRVAFTLAYKQREYFAGKNPKWFSVGKHWNFSWFSYVTNSGSAASNWVHFPDGRERMFYGTTNDYLTNTRLTGATNTGFTLYHPDGSRDVYGFLVTNTIGKFQQAFLSERWNAQEQRTRFFYHSYTPGTAPVIRLRWVVDGDGRTNTISYVTNNAYSTNLIASVTDPFGRSVALSYDSSGRLTNIVDVAGIPSSFTYNSGSLITNLTTPYGNPGFKMVNTNEARSVLISRPDGGNELYVYQSSTPGLPTSHTLPSTSPFGNTLDSTGHDFRNSFYWGPRQYAALSTTNVFALTTNDFLRARMKH